MSLIIEIRAGTGGEDAKDLALMQFGIYEKFAKRNNIEIKVLSLGNGIIIFKIFGRNTDLFKNEGGLLQWQRIPPTEKRGRIHTSTITVAVLPEIPSYQIKIDKKELDWKTCRGSGAGGQHRNVTDSAVQLTHIPTKIKIRCESERSQHANKETALQILAARLKKIGENDQAESYNNNRKKQVGSGERGVQKVRVIRLQDDIVINILNGKRISAKKYIKGMLEELL